MMVSSRFMAQDATPPEDLSFEEAMDSLESIVTSLETDRLPLEEMVASYERGMRLLRTCRGRIESARQRVELITADLNEKGKATLGEFSPQETAETPAAQDAPKRTRRKPVAPPVTTPDESEEDEGEVRLF
jgi:exodeoxyribonuclease VII small subunit